ncbi:phytanoyl-CoA dioxygenase family protein [Micromonospora marina]|uniref:phytanoyl-CoA dioxygenase family protein n=1 Tax=Micromonospora marina TaxID=307120 RepID=UPI003453EB8A
MEPVRVVTLWLAVDESDPGNGCLRVVPGSHRLGLEEMRESIATPNVLGMEIAREVTGPEAVDIILGPGDVEVHHPNIIHGSTANTSSRRRCGLTIRYIPTSTRITDPEQPYPSAFLLRGEPGANRYQEWPALRAGEHFPYRGA